ncbi:hypothetical protein PGT21_007025 [Puccinia graminis f. sp. tritici]|uniref:Uncharacterized protein n=1 Tax=Puccinia graminis f. sp. tritici TaxID=56615 RepID=A0A5B0S012_PUCGR|nr:hypothetical protein PGT21_007025 [Puccinia graminis f. sp. tritici]KAA1130625.1 hypothetical protein PGTUg99_013079 [Puccinia graminis f. sp. tritici]
MVDPDLIKSLGLRRGFIEFRVSQGPAGEEGLDGFAEDAAHITFTNLHRVISAVSIELLVLGLRAKSLP